MNQSKIKIRTKNQSYNIVVGKDLIKNFSKLLKNNFIYFNKCLLVVDNNVPKKIVKKIYSQLKKNKFLFYFKSTEKNKDQKSIDKLLNILLKNNFNRNDCIISMGGGITGDVAGFTASIYKRGIKFINLPTTLLAQVDSSIGGKTGINNKYGKNLIGTFFQPDLVIADTSFLKSLPKREIICGYAEIFKHSLIAGKKYFNYLEKNKFKILKLKSPYIEKAIAESCKIKKRIVEIDEKEKKIRKVLNLGHTFAHAYEAETKYSKKLNHGEAVILGINSAAKFSLSNKLLTRKKYLRIISHINDLNLSNNKKNLFKKKNISSILKFMKTDKKNNSNKINLILLKDIGKPIVSLYFKIDKIRNFFYKELFN